MTPSPEGDLPPSGTTARTVVAEPAVHAAKHATTVAFFGAGFAFASWASRIPQVRDRLSLDPSGLGLVLLAIAIGSMLALPLSGSVVTRWGTRRTVSATAVLLGFALRTVALGYRFGVVPVVAGLFLLGFANGAWDVAMNVQGAVVERGLGRSIMSRFHAGFSLGTVAGALLGVAMIALQVSVTAHLVAVALLVGLSVPRAVTRFLPDAEAETADTDPTVRRDHWAAWRERRTLLIGVFVLAFAFAEGAGNDWISVAVIDGYAASSVVATLVFATFLAAMTAGRWVGPGLLDRYGRVLVVRALALVSVVGVVLFVFGPTTPVAFAGALLWGVGVSLGFPVGMSAGADDPAMAAGRVSVIASLGYCAFLAGPPLLGFLGQQFTVLRALIALVVLLGVAALLAGSVAPLQVRGGSAEADPVRPAASGRGSPGRTGRG